jgi:hypothetical protein
MKRLMTVSGILTTLLLSALTSLAQTPPVEDQQKALEAKRAAAEKALSPSREDLAKYAKFLRASDTGLFRLLPREIYDTATYSPSLKPPDIRGGGAYYSFTKLTHEYGNNDLGLELGQFRVGFHGANYGFLTNLGDVALERITIKSPAALQLSAYARVRQEADARMEYQRFGRGSQIGAVKVKSSLPMQLNSTYLLRAVTYSHTDVLVAFRVVKVESDGSALILWKMLRQYSTPSLARN